jgi:hypothetical protein
MCLELIYENSANRGMIDFSYLAIDDKMIINKSYTKQNDNGNDYIETHSGIFNSHLLFKMDDENSKTVLTALLNYEDVEFGDDFENWNNTLAGQLTYLINNDLNQELLDNVFEMFFDAFHNAGFCNTYISNLIEDVMKKTKMYYCRTVDFQMHEPSNEDLHPGFDT